FSPAAAATAALPTSTSGPAALKSAARSAGKRKPGAVVKAAAMPGRPICAAKPSRSIIPKSCRWPKGSYLGEPAAPKVRAQLAPLISFGQPGGFGARGRRRLPHRVRAHVLGILLVGGRPGDLVPRERIRIADGAVERRGFCR